MKTASIAGGFYLAGRACWNYDSLPLSEISFFLFSVIPAPRPSVVAGEGGKAEIQAWIQDLDPRSRQRRASKPGMTKDEVK